MTISFDLYDRLIADRPFKFAPDDVGYVKAEGDYRCQGCVHFYTREVDDWHTCEILRDVKTDDDEHSIQPDWRCDFWTDGEKYPYLDGDV